MGAVTGLALSNDDELLYRQVHPGFVRDGRVTSQAFRPTPKDDGQLSVALGSLTNAAQAYVHHVIALGLKSAGTFAVSVGECRAEELLAYPQPLTAPPEPVADPAHGFLDFRHFSKAKAEAIGARLARRAVERGCLYRVPVGDDHGGARGAGPGGAV